MKALILAGGLGKRLRPLTNKIPKSLISINGTPIIEWQIKYLKKFKIDNIVICLGYKANSVINYLKSKSYENIEYSIERSPLGTGGAIKNAKSFLNKGSFFVINGDTLTNLNLNLLKKKYNAIATVQLRSPFGILNLEGKKVKEFIEKPLISDYWINAGIYHLSSDIIEKIPSKGNVEDTVFPLMARNDQLIYVKYRNVFLHSIDSHKDIEECTKEMRAIHYRRFLNSYR